MGTSKKIIYVAAGATAIKYYRVYNSGRNNVKAIEITGASGPMSISLASHESIDFAVKNIDITVAAHADEDAEVVYDFLG